MTDEVSTRDLCTLTGITYRQADYWVRMGYLDTIGDGSPGQGHPRSHPASEVFVADGLAQVLRAGCRCPGAVASALREHGPGGNLLLDEDGAITVDLDLARWVVHTPNAVDRLTTS